MIILNALSRTLELGMIYFYKLIRLEELLSIWYWLIKKYIKYIFIYLLVDISYYVG